MTQCAALGAYASSRHVARQGLSVTTCHKYMRMANQAALQQPVSITEVIS